MRVITGGGIIEINLNLIVDREALFRRGSTIPRFHSMLTHTHQVKIPTNVIT